MQVLEWVLEQKCKKHAEENKCLLIKVEKRKGYPDRMLLAPNGQMMWVEFKRAGALPDPFQMYIHQMLRSMRFSVWTIDSFSTFQQALTSLRALPPQSGIPLTTNSAVSSGSPTT